MTLFINVLQNNIILKSGFILHIRPFLSKDLINALLYTGRDSDPDPALLYESRSRFGFQISLDPGPVRYPDPDPRHIISSQKVRH